ncbi:MAG: Hsp20/alpha crystallin family protein [Myxococcales bacterium]|nr:Hsp20/alpha crystallin family protein [Myxococcales bacterium]
MSFFSKLERWLPFKFNRKDKPDAKPETAVEIQRPGSEALARRSPDPYLPATWTMPGLAQTMLADPFFRDPFSAFADLDRWFGDFSPSQFRPTIDVVDEETALCVTAELPGMTKDDVKLQIDDDLLVIRGEKRNVNERKENGVFRSERFYGAFHRAIPLPGDLDLDAIDAQFDAGVLTVRLPKTEGSPSKARHIAIND